MSKVRRNFQPTTDEHRRMVKGQQLGIKNKIIPLDSDIKFYEEIPQRINRGEVKVIPWLESSIGSQSFTLRFNKEQSTLKLLNELSDLFGKDSVDNKTKSIVIVFADRKTKKDVSEKLKKLYVKVT